MKKRFNISNKKRLYVLIGTIFATLLTIILGSVFYLAQPGNIKKSADYGGSSQFVVSIKAPQGVKASSIVNNVAEDIKDRLDPLGIKGVETTPEIYGDEGAVRVVYPGITSADQRQNIEQEIAHKPKLIFTDVYGNPLFTSYGTFNTALQGDPKKFIPFDSKSTIEDLLYRTSDKLDEGVDSEVPIVKGSAKVMRNAAGQEEISSKLNSTSAAEEWAKASKYLSGLPKGKQNLFAWLDPQIMYTKIYNFFKNDPSVLAAKNNLNEFIRVDQKEGNALRKYTVDVGHYLISSGTMSPLTSGNSFALTNNFTPTLANSFARRINYGTADYKLTSVVTLNHKASAYGPNAFKMALIAGAVILAVIAVIMILNYGLLGALATIALALFVFLTLVMFTVMRGEYSPISLAALVVGIGMAIDVIVVTFERLKTEIYKGSTLTKAYRLSQRKSLATIFDANLTTMLVAIILFYFGTRTFIDLPVMLITSIIFAMLIMLLLTRFLATLLVRSNYIQNKRWLLGLTSSFDQKFQGKINKFNHVKNSKWISLSSFAIMLGGLAVFAAFALTDHSFSGGFALSQNFKGGLSITAKVNDSTKSIDDVRKILMASPFNFDASWIHISGNELSAQTTKHFSDAQIQQLRNLISAVAGYSYSVFRTTGFMANKDLLHIIYAILISFAFISVYLIIRFKWTYAVAALGAILHDIFIVTFLFVIFRLAISPIFIVALLTIMIFTIHDKIVIFDRIREQMQLQAGQLNQDKIKQATNIAIKETFKRSILTAGITMIAILILMSFVASTKLSYSLAMLFGLITSVCSSLFVMTWLLIKLESRRQKRIKAREAKGFWNVNGPEEQTIVGINDFVA